MARDQTVDEVQAGPRHDVMGIKKPGNRLLLELCGIAIATLVVAYGLWRLVTIKFDAEAFFCENEAPREVPSPNKTRKLVLYLRNCGATTGYTTNGAILRANQLLPDLPGNAFRIKGALGPFFGDAGAEISVKWNDEMTLIIQHRKGLLFHDNNAAVDGVRVSYVAVP